MILLTDAFCPACGKMGKVTQRFQWRTEFKCSDPGCTTAQTFYRYWSRVVDSIRDFHTTWTVPD